MIKIKKELVSRIAGLCAGLFALGVVMLGGSSAYAWGPNRATFTMQKPATYVTFDSITDNPDWGDERGFALIKDVTDAGSDNNNGTIASGNDNRKFTETVEAKDGHTYMVKMFVHNNAAANYNLTAKNTRLMVSVPTAAGNSSMIQGQIAADNCGANTSGAAGSPCKFWDEAYLTGATGFNFKTSYVAGSARYYNNVKDFKTAGFTLDDGIITENGAKVGYNQMDGNVSGCFQYSGYATFLVKVTTDTPAFTFTKQVRVLTDDMVKNNDTKSGWGYNIKANPGDTIQYKVNFVNVGQTVQKNVIIKDYMDNQLSYLPKSTYIINGNNPRPGINQSDDSWVTKGLNIGSYNPNSNGIVEYKAKVPDNDKLQCGENTFDNVALGYTENSGIKLAQTIVTVHKDCVNPPNPEQPPATTVKCKYNSKLDANDPKCVVPGVPNTSSNIKVAVVSLILFMATGSVLVITLLKVSNNRSGSK